ncbi:MAG: NADH-quinone oxidoreductase subunit I [Kofleriaceae bacterium]|jgi:NADH-quinone oxidoreductase subunit I|nr:NADH-quinone oxidoreductase subunit I [Kofleriaceae bacterium]MBP9169787.1 NADH-quinone oxidoreductase subunit I [Kofleriaceae bacterium]MBP9858122.1 NADH-quinone oxidoreductase subunit I [Kofleriaceae bacterium]
MGSSHAHDDPPPTAGPTVLAVSKVSPKVRTIAVVRPTEQQANYLAATKTGLGITLKHFAKNLFGRRRTVAQLNEGAHPEPATVGEKLLSKISPINDIETIQYPEEKVVYPERFRGLHRLLQRDDGQVRCVACMCCPTVCPANCITIIPEQSDDKGIEKRPAVFEIDELRCVVCGLCVEACPCDAIRMDSGTHAKPVEQRADAIMDKAKLIAVSADNGKSPTSTAVQGGAGANWRELQK